MKPEEVKKWVDDLAKIIDDDESAHTEEDSIHQAVLQAIADGRCEDPRACAAEAMKTKLLDFSRWCA